MEDVPKKIAVGWSTTLNQRAVVEGVSTKLGCSTNSVLDAAVALAESNVENPAFIEIVRAVERKDALRKQRLRLQEAANRVQAEKEQQRLVKEQIAAEKAARQKELAAQREEKFQKELQATVQKQNEQRKAEIALRKQR